MEKILIDKIKDINKGLGELGYSQLTIQRYIFVEVFMDGEMTHEQSKKIGKEEICVMLKDKCEQLGNKKQLVRYLCNADRLYGQLTENLKDYEKMAAQKNKQKIAEKKKKQTKQKLKQKKKKKQSKRRQESNNQNQFISNYNPFANFIPSSDNIFIKNPVNQISQASNFLFKMNKNDSCLDQDFDEYNPKDIRQYLLLREKELLTKKMMEIQLLSELIGAPNPMPLSVKMARI